MIRTLAEIRADRERRSLGRLAVTLLAVSQLDDIWFFTCNGPAVGEECPEDGWEPGDTSSLEDTVAAMKAHVVGHMTTYHPAPDFQSGLEDETPAVEPTRSIVGVHKPVVSPGREDCEICWHSPYDRGQHGSPSGWQS